MSPRLISHTASVSFTQILMFTSRCSVRPGSGIDVARYDRICKFSPNPNLRDKSTEHRVLGHGISPKIRDLRISEFRFRWIRLQLRVRNEATSTG